MSIFDLIANDMRQSFQQTPNLTPYQAIEPAQSLYERNPNVKDLDGQSKEDAVDSSKMDWQEPDDVPTEKLDRILWRSAGGGEYPVWKQGSGAFHSGAGQ
jgi:hypothetical protein